MIEPEKITNMYLRKISKKLSFIVFCIVMIGVVKIGKYLLPFLPWEKLFNIFTL